MAKGTVPSAGDANIEALTKALMAAIAPLAQAIQAQTAAVTGMQASIESLQDRELEVQARKKKQQEEDDGDGDGDEDDDDDDDEEASAEVQADDGDDDVDACSVCGGKGCAKCKGMKGGSIAENADDGDELEDLLDKPKGPNTDPGHLNPEADTNKGSKTSVTTHASAKLRNLLREVIAERDELQAQVGQLRKKVKGMEVSASRIAERTTRRSVPSMAASGNNGNGNINATPLLKGLLAKNSVDISIAASGEGEGLSWEQFNKMLDAANLATEQRLALKIEAERLGVIAGTAA